MGKKATQKEAERREQRAVSLLQTGIRPYRVASALMEEERISRRQANDYVARARQAVNLTEAADRSIAYLVGLVEDEKADPAARRDAARTLAKLGKPQRHEHSGPNGQPMEHAFPDAQVVPNHDAWDREVEQDPTLNGNHGSESNGRLNGQHQ